MAEEKARDPTKPEIKPVSIPLSKIHDLPGSVFAPPSPKSLEALTSSIVLKGVQEPVILRQREDGEFQIVSGNRRRKASELAKKTEIPAFIYDMTEKEARDFRLRGNAKGTPPGKLLPESEIGKKREAPAKTPDKAAENKTPVTQPKPSEKAAEVKVAPTPAQKKQDEKPKAAAPTEKADANGKAPVTLPKLPEKAAELKPAPTPGQKKPEEACRAHHLGDLPVCGHNDSVRLLCLRSWQRCGQYDRRCAAAAGGAGALPVASHPHHGHRKSVVCVLGVRGDRLRLQPVGNEKRTAEQGKVRQNKNRVRPE